MELLLKAGAEKDAQNDKGQTAIHITVGKGHVDTTRLLLAHGVSVNIKVQTVCGSRLFSNPNIFLLPALVTLVQL